MAERYPRRLPVQRGVSGGVRRASLGSSGGALLRDRLLDLLLADGLQLLILRGTNPGTQLMPFRCRLETPSGIGMAALFDIVFGSMRVAIVLVLL